MAIPDRLLIRPVDVGVSWACVDTLTILISRNTAWDKICFGGCWTNEIANWLQLTRKATSAVDWVLMKGDDCTAPALLNICKYVHI